MYLDAQGNVIPDASVLGYRSIATPGSVAGLAYAEKKYGRLGLEKVMAPAIALARDGFVLSEGEAREFADPDLAKFADSKRIFQRDGNLYKAGETFKQPELARTLERIAKDPGGFYHGKMAAELVADLKAGGALLTTASCLLNPNRNPDLTKAEIERRLKDFIGVTKPVAGVDSPCDRGLSALLHGPLAIPGRSGLQPDSRGRADREELRCGMAGRHRS